MRIAISGATGFVGTALVSYLLRETEHEILRLSRSEPTFCSDKRVVTIVGDLADLPSRAAGMRADAMVHLAGAVPGAGVDEHALQAVNVGGTSRMVEVANELGCDHFVLLSSLSVHGKSSAVSTATPISPRDAYGESKAMAESLVADLSKSGVRTSILRPPLIYGRGAHGKFQSLARLVRRRRAAPLLLLGSNRRSLIAVDLLVETLRATLETDLGNCAAPVANGDCVSTAEIVQALSTGFRTHQIGTNVLRPLVPALKMPLSSDKLLTSISLVGSSVVDTTWQRHLSADLERNTYSSLVDTAQQIRGYR